MCALARHDYAAAREIFSKMSDPGREDRLTRYLMYKVALYGNDPYLGTTTGPRTSQILIKHCSCGKPRFSMPAVVEGYFPALCMRDRGTTVWEQARGDSSAREAAGEVQRPCACWGASAGTFAVSCFAGNGYITDRSSMTIRLLTSELVKDGVFQNDAFEQVCKAFDGGALSIRSEGRG